MRLANYPGKVVAALQGGAGMGTMPVNTLKLDSPLRVMNFLDVLNAAAEKFAGIVVQKSAVTPAAPAFRN